MRARPAPSEARRPAAQLVAYGGSRAGSMREGAHPGRSPHTRHKPSPRPRGRRQPLRAPRDGRRRVARKSTTTEPIDPRVRSRPRTRSHPARRRRHGEQPGPTGAGGTATRTSTRSSTATSSATTASCGAPRGSTRRRPSCSARAEDLKGRTVLEIGAGAAQCSRWLAAQGARPVALDLSHRQLQHALRIGGRRSRWCAGRRRRAALRRRLLRPGVLGVRRAALRRRPACWCCARCAGCCGPGGRFVFSVTHPIRWAFPDEPGPEGLTVVVLLLRPHAVRRAGRAGPARSTSSTTARSATGSATIVAGGLPAGGPGRAGVAGLEHARSGAAGPRCAATCSRGRPSSCASGTERRDGGGGRAARVRPRRGRACGAGVRHWGRDP